MVACLHESNDYIKRKLRVWKSKKCNRFLGAKNLLAVAGIQIIMIHSKPNRADNGNLGKLGLIYLHGTEFAPKQWLYEKEATGMESLKM